MYKSNLNDPTHNYRFFESFIFTVFPLKPLNPTTLCGGKPVNYNLLQFYGMYKYFFPFQRLESIILLFRENQVYYP